MPIVYLPLGSGMDADTDPLNTAGPVRVQNLLTDRGRSYDKRSGYATTGLACNNTTQLASFNGGLFRYTDGNAVTSSFRASGVFSAASQTINPMSVTRIPLNAYQLLYDTTFFNGLAAVSKGGKVGLLVYKPTAGNTTINAVPFDPDTGAQYTTQSDSSSCVAHFYYDSFAMAQVTLQGINYIYYFFEDSAGSISGGFVNDNNYLFSPGSPLFSGEAPLYALGDDDRLSVWIAHASGDDLLLTEYIPGTGSSTEETFATSASGGGFFSIYLWRHSSTQLGILYRTINDQDVINFIVYNYSTGSTTWSGSFNDGFCNNITAISTSSTVFKVFSNFDDKIIFRIITSGSVSGATDLTNMNFVGHPFRKDDYSKWWLPVRRADDASGGTPAPKSSCLFYLLSGTNLSAFIQWPDAKITDTVPGPMTNNVVSIITDDTKWGFIAIDYLNSLSPVLLNFVTFDLSAPPIPPQILENGNMILGGALPLEFDGRDMFEAGFHAVPPTPTVTPSTSSGSMAAGDYTVVCTYAYYDNQNNFHESFYDSPATATLAATGKLVITVKTLKMTRRSGVKIRTYRSLVDSSSPLYLADERSNDPTSDTIGFDLTSSDAVVSLNAGLYTNDGVVQNIEPEPFDISCVHQNRFFWSPNLSIPRVFYSKRNASLFATGYNNIFYKDLPLNAGPITAIASMSDKLFVATRNQWFAIEGEGYNDAILGQDYIEPYLVSSNVGCIDYRSVAVIPPGLIFRGEHGFYLFNGNVVPIGQPAQYFSDSFAVRKALVINDRRLVVFLTDGDSLVFNWERNSWTIWTGYTSFDGCMVDNLIVHANTNGTIYKDDRSLFQDAGALIPARFDTGWVNLSKQGNRGRLHRITLYGYKGSSSAQTITVAIRYDGHPDYTQRLTFDTSTLTMSDNTFQGTMSKNPAGSLGVRNYPLTLNFYPKQTLCSSFGLSVYDSAPASGTAGPLTWVGLDFEFYPVAGPARTNAIRRA